MPKNVNLLNVGIRSLVLVIFEINFLILLFLVDLSFFLMLAVVERVFSRQNLIKTDLRNRMNIDTLNMHLHVSLNGPQNFEKFNYLVVLQSLGF